MCKPCKTNPVYIDISGKKFCQKHFLNLYEKKIVYTIRRFSLISKDEKGKDKKGKDGKICVAVSGGKDSMALLYFLYKYAKIRRKKIFVLTIDEGIKGYREKTIVNMGRLCKKLKIDFKIASFKDEFGFTLDDVANLIKQKKLGVKICYVCGILRKWLLNKYAFKLDAQKLATAHCLNDESQTIIVNWLKGNVELLARQGPLSGIKQREKLVQRIKPLYFCTEKENMLYCILNNIKINSDECKYIESYRLYVRNFLNKFEEKHKGTHYAIINTFLALAPLLKEKYKDVEINFCKTCGFPSAREKCRACILVEKIKNFRNQ